MNLLGYAEFVCTVNLPINEIMGGSGGPTVAEAKVKGGKKKEAVVQCAQEACRILNQFGLLRQSNHEARKKRQVKKWKEDDAFTGSGRFQDFFQNHIGNGKAKCISQEEYDQIMRCVQNILK